METDRTAAPTFVRRAPFSLAIVAVVGIAAWGGVKAAPHLLPIVNDVRALGPAAPAGFIVVYAIAMVLLVPSTPLTIVGGALFGLTGGILYSLIAATLGSATAFLLGRYAFRRIVARWLASTPRYAAIERSVSAKGRRILFLLRLSPVMPFNVLNYALGTTTISLSDFLISSAGTVPGTLVYAYFGKVTGEALVLAGQAQVPHDASYYALLLAGLAATIGATALVTRTARRALHDV